MFVYQNKEGNVCITFTGNLPVETPEYELLVDHELKSVKLISSESINDAAIADNKLAELTASYKQLQSELTQAKAELKAANTTIVELQNKIIEFENVSET